MRLTHLASCLAVAITGAIPAGAAAQQPGAQAAPAARQASGEAMVLAITVNTVARGDFFVVRTADGDFLVKTEDLHVLGLAGARPASTLNVGGESHVSLRAIDGLRMLLDSNTQTLQLTVPPSLLGTQVMRFGTRPHTAAAIRDTGPSAFLNYALEHSDGSDMPRPQLSFTGELGLRVGSVLVTTNATTSHENGSGRLVRLMSTAAVDQPEALRRWWLGDFLATSWEHGNGATLGGVGVSKRFALDPYLIRYPTYTLSGAAALPSDVELYVDGQRVRSERVRPGSFELRDLTSYGGARDVYILVRDPFGRVERIDYPLYFSDQPLQKGLHDYSYGIGAMRRSLGARSFDYGGLAYSFYHRYGVTDAVTLGVRGEGTRELANAGAMGTLQLGQAGVLGLAVSGSRIAGEDGAAATLTYSYQRRDFSVDGYARRDSRRYVTLGDPPATSGRRWAFGAHALYTAGALGSFSLSHSVQRGHAGDAAALASPAAPFTVTVGSDRRDTALSHGLPLAKGKAHLTTTVTHVKDKEGSRNELFMVLNLTLDQDRRAMATFQRQMGVDAATLQFTRSPPVGEGVGYDLMASRTSSDDGTHLRGAGSVQYNAPALVLRAAASIDQQRLAAATARANASHRRISVAGGVGYVDGQIAFGRPINDAFALVQTGDLADVPVSVNGQPMGRTNADGRLFLPRLASHIDNLITIAPENLPMEYSFNTTRQRVAPAARGGLRVDFEVQRVQGLSGRLYLETPAGEQRLDYGEVVVRSASTRVALPLGRGGEFYVENLAPGAYELLVTTLERKCRATLEVPVSTEAFVDVGRIACRP